MRFAVISLLVCKYNLHTAIPNYFKLDKAELNGPFLIDQGAPQPIRRVTLIIGTTIKWNVSGTVQTMVINTTPNT